METKETCVKETMESIDNIGRAEANPFLYDKIMSRMQSAANRDKFLNPATIRWALICTALLIGLNVLSLLHSGKENNISKGAAGAFATEYFSYMNNL
jgi:hypothetical protein